MTLRVRLLHPLRFALSLAMTRSEMLWALMSRVGRGRDLYSHDRRIIRGGRRADSQDGPGPVCGPWSAR
ncbi:protein of unknown function [Candidatus Methylomirabilis oxygeniifera]|uniref:Uncharacterized protein n=1 Tax=Methylomirabilis oxygeniifera TaxID=671143 RepID=D5MFP6_METO1|nr:protein of unknown function [Candidatus Methylomirabilis oxyfera]